MPRFSSVVVRAGLIFVPLFLFGCTATTYRAHPRFQERFDESKTVAVIQPRMRVYQLTAGGVSEFMYEWSVRSQETAAKIIAEKTAGRLSKRVTFINPPDFGRERDLFDSQAGMFSTVSKSVVDHTYKNKTVFRHKVDDFQYTLGSEVQQLKQFAPDADLFIFCAGQKYIWTPGRVSLAFVSGALGFFMPAGSEWLILGVVDGKTGDLLWFDYVNKPGDLRDRHVLERLLEQIFERLSQAWRKE